MTSSTSNGGNKPLEERVVMPDSVGGPGPEVPAEARQGLARLGEEFSRAEVEICMFNSKPFLQKKEEQSSITDIFYRIQTKVKRNGKLKLTGKNRSTQHRCPHAPYL